MTRDGKREATIEERLQYEYHFVCRVFFPEWDNRQWSVFWDRTPSGFRCASCNCSSKQIHIPKVPRDKDLLHMTLVREIATAIIEAEATGLTHYKRWQQEYLRAADIADKIDRPRLAWCMRRDAKRSVAICV
jgi:hypothetical protein